MNAASLPVLWTNCVDRLKDRINNRSFWEALEATRAITIENDSLIIGMEPENFNRASHILQVSTLNTVHRVVEEIFGRPLQLLLIDGTTFADWEAHKAREARVTASKQADPQAFTTAPRAAAGTWDSIYEQLSRLFAQSPHRALPQGKARYANEALYLLVEAMDTIYPENPDEHTERNLARAIDRIAMNSDIPAPVVAFELERLRAWRKSAAAS
ncbi:MAG TPA: hypothetical protein VKT77_14075 [Chthonomonadaceae bacterium]|nr:hypothetical protein [Chthonomonadaceae bacterium]